MDQSKRKLLADWLDEKIAEDAGQSTSIMVRNGFDLLHEARRLSLLLRCKEIELPEPPLEGEPASVIRIESEWVWPCSVCFRMTHWAYKNGEYVDDIVACCRNHTDSEISVALVEMRDASTARKIPNNRYLARRPVPPQPYRYTKLKEK